MQKVSTHLLTSQLENFGQLYALAALSAAEEPEEPTGYSLLKIRIKILCFCNVECRLNFALHCQPRGIKLRYPQLVLYYRTC